ncbi:MAG: tyrosine-type recombinase/integrase [Saprospiraceae bacterium]|nr:tyrosine-type recombinase/integrase [Candidatus Vicinibacter affinis]
MKIINLYRNKDHAPKNFLFPILEISDNAETIRNKTKNFTRFINQHIKKIAQITEINPKISTYYARHSFATIARNRGTNVEMISVMLAHSDISTTQNYLDSFNSDQTRELSETIYQGF